MKTLAMDLSSGRGTIALLDDDHVAFDRNFPNDRKHSGLFFENLQLCAKNFSLLELIVVGLGPGSYAGVRIAIASAIGLGVAHKARLIGLASICALETDASEYWVVGDAKRQSFFSARISNGRLVEGPSLHSTAELEVKLHQWHLPVYASEPLPRYPQAMLAFPVALKLAALARAQDDGLAHCPALEPIYLRGPHITMPKTVTTSLKR